MYEKATRSYTDAEFEERRHDFVELWTHRDYSLPQVVGKMKEIHNFHATYEMLVFRPQKPMLTVPVNGNGNARRPNGALESTPILVAEIE